MEGSPQVEDAPAQVKMTKELEAAATYAGVAMEVEAQLMASLKDARQQCAFANEFAEAAGARLEAANEAHAAELARIRTEHAEQIEALERKHALEVDHARELARLERRRSAAAQTPVGAPTPSASSSSPNGLSPTVETPEWLREAGGLAADESRAVAEAAQAQMAHRHELEQRVAEVNAQRAVAEAQKQQLDDAVGARQQALDSAATLRSRCEALEAERDALLEEKRALLAEVANQAGHLNHKQKIHYVARLKQENEELREQIRAMKDGASGKENAREGPRADKTGRRATAPRAVA
jgi:hypothetical protein